MIRKINRRSIMRWGIQGGIALLFTLASWFSIHAYIQHEITNRPVLEEDAQIGRVEVIVARHDLIAGRAIELSSLALRFLEEESLPQDHFQVDDVALLDGAILQYPVKAGKAVQASYLYLYDEVPLSQRIEQGERALLMEVDDAWAYLGQISHSEQFDLYEIKEGYWEKLLSAVHVIELLPKKDRELFSSYTHVVFSVPEDLYAYLIDLKEQGALAPVLIGEQSASGPDVLMTPFEAQIVGPQQEQNYQGGW